MSGGASGHRKSLHYPDVKGIKVGDGQTVRTGTLLTREGDKWRPGKNVGGLGNLFAKCDGVIKFTKKRGNKGSVQTYINIVPTVAKK